MLFDRQKWKKLSFFFPIPLTVFSRSPISLGTFFLESRQAGGAGDFCHLPTSCFQTAISHCSRISVQAIDKKEQTHPPCLPFWKVPITPFTSDRDIVPLHHKSGMENSSGEKKRKKSSSCQNSSHFKRDGHRWGSREAGLPFSAAAYY